MSPQPSTVLNGAYAGFLHNRRLGADRAEAFFKKAIELDPADGMYLSNYAAFLLHERNDSEGAELLFRRALETDPVGDDTLGNYAQLLLATGRKNEAKLVLDRIGKGSAENARSVTLNMELLIYRYAHQLGTPRAMLRKLKEALSNGERTPNWNFDPNLRRAEEEGHPNLPLLRDLALVATGKAKLSVLEAHEDWKSIRS